MIDIRCHLLDQTVSGASGFDEALEMCRLAVEDGIHTIVATPVWDAYREEPPQPFADYSRTLKKLQDEIGDRLSLQLGFVLRFSTALPSLVKRYGAQLALGGKRHLLVSLPAMSVPTETEEVWRALRGLGYSIIIARPECNPALRRDPERLRRWISEGTLLQLDALSVTGDYGRGVQSFALRAASDHGASVILASNARDAVRRRPVLSQAREHLGKKLGSLLARGAVEDIPNSIISPTLTKSAYATSRPSQSLFGGLPFNSLWRL